VDEPNISILEQFCLGNVSILLKTDAHNEQFIVGQLLSSVVWVVSLYQMTVLRVPTGFL